MLSAKKRWEYFPEELGRIAKTERVFNFPVKGVMMPAAQTNAFYARFIEMAKTPRNYPVVSEPQIQIAKNFVEFAAAAQAGTDRELLRKNPEYVELTWPAYRAKMLENPGFARWVLEAGVLHSFYLYCFYIDVDGFLGFDPELRKKIRPLTTYQMDTAFGMYRDTLGNLREIPDTDAAMWHCINSSLWRDVSERAVYASYYMREAGHGARVLDLCCGAFNLERRFGYLDAGLHQQVIGYDNDPNVVAVTEKLFGNMLQQCDFSLHCENCFNAFDDPDLISNVDIVLMNGGLSYNKSRAVDILSGARRVLKTSVPGEVPKRLVINREVATIDMAHALHVLGLKDQHDSLDPDMSVEQSIASMKADIEKAGGGYHIEKIITDEGFYGEDVELAPTFVQFVLDAV